ncbi:hypothetical protein [Paracoccus sp. (in: a-proteobacteria)]|uniref:hypothetical protein n=1 Tax=Paracoccus sp. TaxID=267 RepID=UPI00396C5082
MAGWTRSDTALRRQAAAQDRDAPGGLWPAALPKLATLMMLVVLRLGSGAFADQYLVVTRPFLSPIDVFETACRAGGGVTAFGAVPGAMIAISSHPYFPNRIRQAGVWLVLPTAGRFGCRPSSAVPARWTVEIAFLRLRCSWLLLAMIWAHVPMIGMVSLAIGRVAVPTALLAAAALAAVYHIIWHRHGIAPISCYVGAVVLVAEPSLLLMEGHPWQRDMHMYVFAMIVMNIAWFDPRPLFVAAATTTTTLHHLTPASLRPTAFSRPKGMSGGFFCTTGSSSSRRWSWTGFATR